MLSFLKRSLAAIVVGAAPVQPLPERAPIIREFYDENDGKIVDELVGVRSEVAARYNGPVTLLQDGRDTFTWGGEAVCRPGYHNLCLPGAADRAKQAFIEERTRA